MSVGALVRPGIEQNGRKPVFPVFPDFPDPDPGFSGVLPSRRDPGVSPDPTVPHMWS